MLLYHGTTSSRAEAILREGFHLPAYFAPDVEGAAHYASCGGEWDLQAREEAFHAGNGEWPRDLYDLNEMHRMLYPAGDTPVVVVVEVPDPATLRADSGAGGGMVADAAVPGWRVVEIVPLEWHPTDDGYPMAAGWAPSPGT